MNLRRSASINHLGPCLFCSFLVLQLVLMMSGPSWQQCLTFHFSRSVLANIASFVLTCWIDPDRLKILSEHLTLFWVYMCVRVNFFFWFSFLRRGVVHLSHPTALRLHIGLATPALPQETHNYNCPFRLVQQTVQLWLHSRGIYFIPFSLLRGTPHHNGLTSLYNNACDDKHGGS